MIHSIDLLGSLRVRADPPVKLPQKAKGLLALLAIAAVDGEPMSRERLAATLWPYQGTEQSRHSLRNCLLELRKAMRADAVKILTADFATCRLEARTDVAEFAQLEKSLNQRNLAAAAELYRGDFLDDFWINSEPFREWLNDQRERWRLRGMAVLATLSTVATANGDRDVAVAAARRLVHIDNLNETGHRLLISALDKAGHHGEAVLQYRRCRESLKVELGVEPSPETSALAKRLFALTGVPPTAEGAASPTSCWPCILPRFVIGVCPIRNLTNDPAYDHLADAFTQDMLTDVLRRHAIGFDVKWPPDEASARHSSNHWCDYVISGSLQCSGPGLLRVNIRITDEANSTYLWAGRNEVKPAELPLLQPRITARVSRELCLLLLKMASRSKHRSAGADSAECLREANAALNKDDGGPHAVIDAQHWFLAAVAANPHDIMALRGLAMTCRHLVDHPTWADALTRGRASYLESEVVSIGRAIAPAAFRYQETAIECQTRLRSEKADLVRPESALTELLPKSPEKELEYASF